MAQQNQQSGMRGGRRSSRGGRGSSDVRSPTTATESPASSTRNNPPINTSAAAASPDQPRPPQTPAPPAAQPTAPAAVQPTPAAPTAAPRPPSIYYYDYLTEERLSTWSEGGRAAVLKAIDEVRDQQDTLGISMIFEEFMRATLEQKLQPAEAGRVMKEWLSTSSEEELLRYQNLFVDTVEIIIDEVLPNPDYASRLRDFIVATDVSPDIIRVSLDAPAVEMLGFVRGSFKVKGIRKTTGLLYRQSNYNLLREESEGYSKLMTEYFTTTANSPPSGEVVAETFERVKALIGAFDLDVGRALDVTLDVSASLLIKHFRFFVKLLRVSSWWPERRNFSGSQDERFSSLPRWALPDSSSWTTTDADRNEQALFREQRDVAFWDRAREIGVKAFFELGGRRIPDGVDATAFVDEIASTPSEADEGRQWVEVTKTLPPPGSRTAAQLLGFKLRFYASSTRDPSDNLPDNLIYLSALLIKIGFIALRDLYPHLYPPDDKMGEVKARAEKEKAERERKNRPGGGMNALLMAGALADDMAPAPAPIRPLREIDGNRAATPSKTDDKTAQPTVLGEDGEKIDLPEPVDQKLGLLKSLLCIGALPESLYILGRYPWFMDVYPELPEYIHRFIHFSIDKVYEPVRPLAARDSLRAGKKPIVDVSPASKGTLQPGDPVPHKVVRWAMLDRPGAQDGGIDYKFYWDDWSDNVPVCQTVDDLFTLCGTLLNISGFKIGQDGSLLTKIARIGKKSLADDSSEANMKRWQELLKRLLVPSLSLTKANPGVVNEVYDLLKFFPTAVRYNIYAEWNTGQISRTDDIKAAFDLSRAETKDVLKRISKTNTKQMARALAKVAYVSPGIVFQVALNQIESYDNLIDVVVECARYFTYLGYDVLTWSLMSALAGRGRDRVKADGMLTSSWLRALASFAGRVFKRYSIMSVTPILQYVSHQLRLGNSTDLLVLEQIVSAMTGTRSDINFNEYQTLAMAGGESLQAVILKQLLDVRHEASVKHSSKRLVRSLVEATKPALAPQLLIAIAQERQQHVFRSSVSEVPIKVLGTNLDAINEMFVQFLSVLQEGLTPKDFDAVVPDMVTLCSEYGIELGTAFIIYRKSISAAIAEADAAIKLENKNKRRDTNTSEPPTDIEMTNGDTAKTIKEPAVNGVKSESKEEDGEVKEEQSKTDIVMDDVAIVEGQTPTATTPAASNGTSSAPWHPALSQIMDRIRAVLPDKFDNALSLPFYVTFWQLSLQDMHLPSSAYHKEVDDLLAQHKRVSQDRSDVTTTGVRKREAQKKALMASVDALKTEAQSRMPPYMHTRNRLKKEKDHWFASYPLDQIGAVNNAILQECFLPRVVLSELDAQYCFRMLLYMHTAGTPGFITMRFLYNLFDEKKLASIAFSCTAREIENFGNFLNEILTELRKWHKDSEVYEKQAHGVKKDLIGFAKKFNQDKQPIEFLNFEDFRRLLFKWHTSSLHKTFQTLLKDSNEYAHRRNGITLLKAISPNFPIVNFIGKQQIEFVENIRQHDSRDDLKVAATALLGALKKHEKDWLMPQAFRLAEQDPNAKGKDSRAGSARPATPQPSAATPKTSFNAEAKEFKPTTSLAAGDERKPSMAQSEKEDGELTSPAETTVPVHKLPPKESAEKNPRSTPVPAPQPEPKTAPEPEKALPEKSSAPAPRPARAPLPPQEQVASIGLTQHGSRNSTAAGAHSDGRRFENRTLDNTRPGSSQGTPGRPMHGLPTRPEGQFPPHSRLPAAHRERPGEVRPDSRGAPRLPQTPETGRSERAADTKHEPHSDRRDHGDGRRSRARTPDTMPVSQRDRHDPVRDTRRPYEEPPARPAPDSRGGPRHSASFDGPRDRASPDVRSVVADPSNYPHSKTHGATSMAPPAGPLHPSERDRMSSTGRTTSFQDQQGPSSSHSQQQPRDQSDVDMTGVNPARAALIGADLSRQQPDDDRPPRREKPSRRDGPRRDDDHSYSSRDYIEPQREDSRDHRMSASDRHPDQGYHGRERYQDQNSHAPTGPRGDRHDRLDAAGPPQQQGRGRELFQSNQPSRPQVDPSHGRLSQDFSRPQQDENYGRLNQGADPPSGPRGRATAGRGGRPPSISGPPHNNLNLNNRVPTSPSTSSIPDQQLPSSPRADRRSERRQSGYHDQSRLNQSSAPPTPSNEQPDTTGVHPSRLERINPLPIQTDVSSHGSVPPSQASPANAPSGPRSSTRGPTSNHNGPSPTTHLPPSGPASSMERRGEDRRFHNLHSHLQQGTGPNQVNGAGAPAATGSPGTSIRGRANRPLPGQQQQIPSTIHQQDQPAYGSRASNGRVDTSQRPDLMVPRQSNIDSSGAPPERTDSRNSRRESSRRDDDHRSARDHGGDHDESSQRRHDDRRSERNKRGEEGREGGSRDDRSHRSDRDRRESSRHEESRGDHGLSRSGRGGPTSIQDTQGGPPPQWQGHDNRSALPPQQYPGPGAGDTRNGHGDMRNRMSGGGMGGFGGSGGGQGHGPPMHGHGGRGGRDDGGGGGRHSLKRGRPPGAGFDEGPGGGEKRPRR